MCVYLCFLVGLGLNLRALTIKYILKHTHFSSAPEAHTYNPTFLGGWDSEDQGSGSAWANSSQGQDPISKITRANWIAGMSKAVECLLCKHEALRSNPSPMKKKYLFSVLGVKPRVSHRLGKHFTIELHLTPVCVHLIHSWLISTGYCFLYFLVFFMHKQMQSSCNAQIVPDISDALEQICIFKTDSTWIIS
jgi:hypothetical protein